MLRRCLALVLGLFSPAQAAPESARLKPGPVADLAQAAKDADSTGFAVLRDGKFIAGFGEKRPMMSYSVTLGHRFGRPRRRLHRAFHLRAEPGQAGQLILNRGRWGVAQVLPEGWVRQGTGALVVPRLGAEVPAAGRHLSQRRRRAVSDDFPQSWNRRRALPQQRIRDRQTGHGKSGSTGGQRFGQRTALLGNPADALIQTRR